MYLIKGFIQNHKIEKYTNIRIEYPYDNLKKYLEQRGLEHLAKYVDWEDIQSSLETHRSKSFIWNQKLYIKHHSPRDYGHLLKIEAHIRFMNAMWYANKYLMKIVRIATLFFGSLYFIFTIIVENKLIYSIRTSQAPEYLKKAINILVNIFHQISYSIFHTYSRDRFVFCFLLSFIISIAYLGFGYLIKKTIINNFHYQRIREIVSVLEIYHLVENDISNESNKSKGNSLNIDIHNK